MSIVVQKYGGSSLEGHARIEGVASRVAALRREGHDVVVVVSARGGTTDSLVEEARLLAPEPKQRELDMLMTAGERISMSLLAIALNAIGCPAVSFTGSQVGIITDTRHTDARILEVRPFRVVEELEAGNVVVVGGFQGVSTAKDVTTLGRGGSDTTAVALAAALGAERCEILTDVDGVYTADPRAVPSARRIDAIAYADMAELARYGATVLKEDAVRFAERNGIAIGVGSSERGTAGTIVLEDPPHAPRPVTGLALVAEASLMELPESVRAQVVREFEEAGAPVRLVVGTRSATLVVVEGHPRGGASADEAEVRPVSLIAIVGPGAAEAAVAAAAISVVEDLGCAVEAMVSSGRSTVIAVSRDAADRVIGALHDALLGEDTAR